MPKIEKSVVQGLKAGMSSAYISESNLFGAEFVASGITEDDSLNILFEEMTSYLNVLSKTFVFSAPLPAPPAASTRLQNSHVLATIEDSPQSIGTSSISMRLENCMKNSNINAAAKQNNAISQLYEYAQKNDMRTPEIAYFTENSLFGCNVAFNSAVYTIDATFRKKADAKEAACKHILKALNIPLAFEA